MFTSLHALAKKATLMITVAAEGDDQLRVNVTPMPADTKAKSNLPAPLSLLATPVEFDADFVAALSTWQAPKRTLLQQAQDAAGGAAPALPAPKSEAKGDGKADKAGRKARAGKGAGEASASANPDAGEASASPVAGEASASASTNPDAGVAGASTDTASAEVQALGATAGDAGAAREGQDSPPAPAPAPDAGDEQVDKFTLDLF